LIYAFLPWLAIRVHHSLKGDGGSLQSEGWQIKPFLIFSIIFNFHFSTKIVCNLLFFGLKFFLTLKKTIAKSALLFNVIYENGRDKDK